MGDDLFLEPVGASRRVRGDDDLVRPERPEGVLHRLERIGVADLAARLDTLFGECGERPLEPLLCLRPRAVFIRGPVPKWRVQRRTDNEDVGVGLLRPTDDLAAEGAAGNGLVRDHENPLPLAGSGAVAIPDSRFGYLRLALHVDPQADSQPEGEK